MKFYVRFQLLRVHIGAAAFDAYQSASAAAAAVAVSSSTTRRHLPRPTYPPDDIWVRKDIVIL